MTKERDETSKELIGAFRRLHKVLHKSVFRSLTRKLKPSPFMVMMQLVRASRSGADKQRVSDIADTIGMTTAAVTQILNVLESEGHIRRETDPNDRRAVLVSLTESGMALMEQDFRQLTESFDGLEAHLGVKDSSILLALLEKVEKYFSE